MALEQKIKPEAMPLSTPVLNGKEWQYIKDCLDTGWVSSAGKYVEEFEKRISEFTGGGHAVACISGTSALHISLKLAGVMPGDEVIVPTVTFIASVNVIQYVNAEPVFMDCDDYYNIDAEKTVQFIESETTFTDGCTVNNATGKVIRAIIPVHVFGNAADLNRLAEVCRKRNIKIIEDATESLGTAYKDGRHAGLYTGAVGDFGCFSFNGNKIITAGGGGMIVTKDPTMAQKAQYLTTQAKDDPIRSIHHDVGYNYRLNNLQAAMGVAQLETLEKTIEIKKKNYLRYKAGIDAIDGLHLSDVPKYANNNFWMYALRVDERAYGHSPAQLIELLSKENIEARPLWHLNHLQRPYKECQTYNIRKANEMLATTINIPCSANLSEEMIARFTELLSAWKK